MFFFFRIYRVEFRGVFCACGNYILNSIKCGEFHEKISDYFNIKMPCILYVEISL